MLLSLSSALVQLWGICHRWHFLTITTWVRQPVMCWKKGWGLRSIWLQLSIGSTSLLLNRLRQASKQSIHSIICCHHYNQRLFVKLSGCLFPTALASPGLWNRGKAVYGVGFCKGWPVAGAPGW